MKRTMQIVAVLVVLCWGLAALAQAAIPAAPPSPDDLTAFVTAVFNIVGTHQWSMLIPLGIMVLTFALRKLGAKVPALDDFLHSDPGGVLLALLAAFAGFLGAALIVPGAVLSLKLVGAAAMAAIVAMGGFSLVNKLLIPLWQYIAAKVWPDGKAQAAAVTAQAATDLAKANAQPAQPGSAAANMEQIK